MKKLYTLSRLFWLPLLCSTLQGSTYELRVTPLLAKDAFIIDCYSSDTIQQIKEKIKAQEGYPVEEQILMPRQNPKPCEDDKSFADYNLYSQGVYLRLQAPSPPKPFFKIENKKRFFAILVLVTGTVIGVIVWIKKRTKKKKNKKHDNDSLPQTDEKQTQEKKDQKL